MALFPAVPRRRTGDPFMELFSLPERLERLLGEVWGLGPRETVAGVLAPPLDMRETDREFVVTVELPGVDKKDIKVDLSDDVLTIEGEKREEKDRESGNYHVIERSWGSFRRSVRLPAEVDRDAVSATFKDGVLEVKLPKTEKEQKRTRKIEVK